MWEFFKYWIIKLFENKLKQGGSFEKRPSFLTCWEILKRVTYKTKEKYFTSLCCLFNSL